MTHQNIFFLHTSKLANLKSHFSFDKCDILHVKFKFLTASPIFPWKYILMDKKMYQMQLLSCFPSLTLTGNAIFIAGNLSLRERLMDWHKPPTQASEVPFFFFLWAHPSSKLPSTQAFGPKPLSRQDWTTATRLDRRWPIDGVVASERTEGSVCGERLPPPTPTPSHLKEVSKLKAFLRGNVLFEGPQWPFANTPKEALGHMGQTVRGTANIS